MSKEVARILKNKGIVHSTATSHTPQLNVVAEQFNRTIMMMVQSLLLTSGLDHAYWGEALRFTVYVNNRLTAAANKDNVMLYEQWTGKSGTLNHISSYIQDHEISYDHYHNEPSTLVWQTILTNIII